MSLLSKFQLPSSYGLGVKKFYTGSVNDHNFFLNLRENSNFRFLAIPMEPQEGGRFITTLWSCYQGLGRFGDFQGMQAMAYTTEPQAEITTRLEENREKRTKLGY